MFKKFEGIIVDDKEPFKNDQLGRETIIKNLTKLIKDLEQPFVISINAPWGTGKTTFINIWEKYLKLENFVTLNFNAWENDFSNEPLITLIGEIREQLSKIKLEGTETITKYSDKILKSGKKVLLSSLPLLTKLITMGIASSEDISDFLSKMTEQRIKKYSEDKKTQIDFKNDLENVANVIVEKSGKKKPIIFFIDELDRCRPTFTIELLEAIKHIFSVNNFVFVLAVDRKQLGYSIQTLYGKEMDTEGYLRRFIDLNFTLPEPDLKKYCNFMAAEYKIRSTPFEINIKHDPEIIDKLLIMFTMFSNIFNLSLRDIEHCFTQFKVILETTPKYSIYFFMLIALFVPLRLKYFNSYNNYINREIRPEELISDLRKFKKYNDYLNQEPYHYALLDLEFVIDFAYLETLDELDEKSKYYSDMILKSSGNEKEIWERKSRNSSMLRVLFRDSKFLKSIKETIEFASKFE